jgi:twitching motility protein PilT
MIDIKSILADVIENNASDLHINVGMPPVLRRNTELVELDFPALSNEDAKEMVLSMVGPEKMKRFEENRDLDFSTQIPGGHRFRVNAHWQRDTIAISFRVILNQVRTVDDLHLPAIVKELTDLPRGLGLVTGHTGSGKSTTLAAMIGLINARYRRIDPWKADRNHFGERRVGSEIGSGSAIFCGTRCGGPDIIMVGGARPGANQLHHHGRRNGVTWLSTLHTINAARIRRIIDISVRTRANPDDAGRPPSAVISQPAGSTSGHGTLRCVPAC